MREHYMRHVHDMSHATIRTCWLPTSEPTMRSLCVSEKMTAHIHFRVCTLNAYAPFGDNVANRDLDGCLRKEVCLKFQFYLRRVIGFCVFKVLIVSLQMARRRR
jgi:hypothetical protein